jgi:ferredoxin
MAEKQRIDLEICIECAACVPECPVAAISPDAPFVIDPEVCTNCGACPAACPVEAISGYDYTSPEPPAPATPAEMTTSGWSGSKVF